MRCTFVAPIVLAAAVLLNAAPPVRLHHAIKGDDETFVLKGHRSARVALARDLGETADSLTLSNLALHFKMSPAQAADLDVLLQAQRDRNSRWYHKWLTPEEFGQRFGVNDSDLKRVREWLEDSGFSNVEIPISRTMVRFSGQAADVRNAFGTSLHRYRQSGQEFHANDADPVLPRVLKGLVSSIHGLSSDRPRPYIRRVSHPQMSIGINGNHFLTPDDIAVIYNLRTLYSRGIDGTGQKIVIVGQSDIDPADIQAFRLATSQPNVTPTVITVGPDPGKDPGNMSEAHLDLEWAGAVARGAEIIYVNSDDVLYSTLYAIEKNLAPVISISYGLCELALPPAEMESYDSAFAQANAQGITIVVASGDSGAAGCDFGGDTPQAAAIYGLAVNFPASSPHVTAVGGTEFDDSQGSFWNASGQATSYIPEIAWNDSQTFGVLSGAGGGVSTQFTKPAWQQGAGVPPDGARDVPDVALSASPAHDAYLICSGGSCSNGFAPPLSELYFVGGTSCSAPVLAGILALLNQASVVEQSTSNGQGNINAGLYNLASFNSGVFHDILLGDNRVSCQAGTPDCFTGKLGYSTGPGYDLVTGLGSIDATQLIDQWGSDFQLAIDPALLKFSMGGAATANIVVTRFANFTGSVGFTCSVESSLGNTTCSVPQSPVSGEATLTVSNSQVVHAGLPFFPTVAPPGPAAWLTIAFVGGLFWVSRRKTLVYAGLAALSLIALTSCGSGSTRSTSIVNSPPLTGNVIVTATSGMLQHVIRIPVSISPAS